jgi:hypothetical protein
VKLCARMLYLIKIIQLLLPYFFEKRGESLFRFHGWLDSARRVVVGNQVTAANKTLGGDDDKRIRVEFRLKEVKHLKNGWMDE